MLHFQRLDIVATNGLNHATKVELKFLKTGVVGLHCIASRPRKTFNFSLVVELATNSYPKFQHTGASC